MGKVRERKTSSRRDTVMIISGISMIGMLVFRLVLGKLIGDIGIACFGIAYEIYFVIAGAVSYGLSEAVSSLVRYRVRRGQYKNAQKVLGGAVLAGCVLGAVIGAVILLWAHTIAGRVFGVPLSGQAVFMIAPAIIFLILTGILRGYFQGNGARVPVMHSQILQVFFFFAGGMAGVVPFRNYGTKVSALLQNPDYANAYGAMGACIGILCASILCLLHLLIIYILFRHGIHDQLGREPQKSQDGMFYVLRMVLGTGGIYALYCFFSNGWLLVDAAVMFRAGRDAEGLIGQWGAYYGKVMALIGIAANVISMICLYPIRRIVVLWERDEDRLAREKLGILVHQCAAIAIPAAIFLAVLAENLLDMIYGGDNSQSALWIQAGCVTIVLFVFTNIFMEILLRSRKLLFVAGITAGGFVLQLGVMFLLVRTDMEVMGLIVSSIVYYLAIAGCSFFLVARRIRYRQEWIRTFAVTAVAAAIAGILAMVLNKVAGPLGALISMLISLAAAIAVYLVILIFLRAFRNEELDEMAGGFLFKKLARLFRM